MDLELNISQSLSLTPKLIQSMEILRMDSHELEERIAAETSENPVLERDERSASPSSETFRRSVPRPFYSDRRGTADADSAGLIADTRGESLAEHLLSQLSEKALELPVRRAAEHIISGLDERGYSSEDTLSVARTLGISEADAAEAFRTVQSLEPEGVGARDLAECLCIQLRAAGESGLALTLAAEHLYDIARGKKGELCRSLGVSRDELEAACALIRTLDPRPGLVFSPADPPEYVTAELAVNVLPDRLELTVNEDVLPHLHMSEYYVRMLRESDDDAVREYLRGKAEQARWIISALERRRDMLLRCAGLLIETQEDFFRFGPGYLKPMTLSDAAEKLGVHVSTVSRAVRGKYILCPWGVYPMARLFSRSVGGTSAAAAKAAIAELTAREDPANPLSDQKLCIALAGRGIHISRRTAAKYRAALGIPSTLLRRRSAGDE